MKMKMKMFVVFGILLHVSQQVLAGIVEVNEGAESVLLPCFSSGFMLEDVMVTWTNNDLHPNIVHQRQEEDNLKNQNQVYKNRTSMRPDALDSGDLSLTLRKPRLSDEGVYICSIKDEQEELRVTDVQLKVKGDEEQVKVTEGAESVILPCRTSADLPEDTTVEWTRSEPVFMFVHVFPNTSKHYNEQEFLYRGRTEMKKDLLRTGDLSLTLMDPTDTDRGDYICTVYRDQDILRQKVALIHVKEKKSSTTKIVIIVVVLLIVVISGSLLFYYRQYFKSGYQVQFSYGEQSVLLPCKTLLQLPEGAKVEWKDGDDRLLHLYEKNSDQLKDQHVLYKNRTKMKNNRIKSRNLSLILKHPIDDDENTYTCAVYNGDQILLTKQTRLLFKRSDARRLDGPRSLGSVEQSVDSTNHSVQLTYDLT